jgi:hypothetical protein
MTNSFYTYNNNKLENFGKISEECKNYLKDILSPCTEIENKIEFIFNSIYKLNSSKNYKVIHLRFGDIFIHNNVYDNRLYDMYFNKINNLINSDTEFQYVLISDSSIISNRLKENIIKLHYWNNNKIHLGDLKNNTSNSILDTLTDFFIMSKSAEITSNGSGFSRIASEIYDIPYNYI